MWVCVKCVCVKCVCVLSVYVCVCVCVKIILFEPSYVVVPLIMAYIGSITPNSPWHLSQTRVATARRFYTIKVPERIMTYTELSWSHTL